MTDQVGSSGFLGSSGRKKRTSFLSCFTSLKALAREPTSFAIRFNSSSNTSHRRLVKMSGRMNSLYFGASLAPRMLHAASHIQLSSDLPFWFAGVLFFADAESFVAAPVLTGVKCRGKAAAF